MATLTLFPLCYASSTFYRIRNYNIYGNSSFDAVKVNDATDCLRECLSRKDCQSINAQGDRYGDITCNFFSTSGCGFINKSKRNSTVFVRRDKCIFALSYLGACFKISGKGFLRLVLNSVVCSKIFTMELNGTGLAPSDSTRCIYLDHHDRIKQSLLAMHIAPKGKKCSSDFVLISDTQGGVNIKRISTNQCGYAVPDGSKFYYIGLDQCKGGSPFTLVD